MNYTFNKKEKLKSQKLIEQLFAQGQSVVAHPLRMVYIKAEFDEAIKIKAGVSVSKRHFKKAVDRNRIKRLMREAYRLQKAAYFDNISGQYALMILYIGKEEIDFKTIYSKMDVLLKKFQEKISQV
uniref:ribonuclease P protein component n=1 Tax=Gelidibacter sp. TaxID=2018083 RepID=UPI004049A808